MRLFKHCTKKTKGYFYCMKNGNSEITPLFYSITIMCFRAVMYKSLIPVQKKQLPPLHFCNCGKLVQCLKCPYGERKNCLQDMLFFKSPVWFKTSWMYLQLCFELWCWVSTCCALMWLLARRHKGSKGFPLWFYYWVLKMFPEVNNMKDIWIIFSKTKRETKEDDGWNGQSTEW